MEYKTLSNGVKMPVLGYGVFQIDDETTERCVADAIASGYRLIDTAQAYGNERGVGAAVKASGVAREDLFIVSKVWVSNYGEGATYDSIKRSCELLGVEQIDLMLLHQAYGDYHAAWRDMERAYDDGLVRAIGVSNFDPTRLLDICTFARIAPMVNQVETHVFWQQGYSGPDRRGARQERGPGRPALPAGPRRHRHSQVYAQGAHGGELRRVRLRTHR